MPIFCSTGRRHYVPMAETAMGNLVPAHYGNGYSIKNKWRAFLRQAAQVIVKAFGEPDPGFNKFRLEEDMPFLLLLDRLQWKHGLTRMPPGQVDREGHP